MATMSTTPAEQPEPADQTVLYWPEDEDRYALIAIRDDGTAEDLDTPDAHWFVPNGAEPAVTWPQFQQYCDLNDQPIADAIRIAGGQ